MFEAGAISRRVERARICPVLFGIEPTDVQGPLARFQLTKFSQEEIFQLLTAINSKAGDDTLTTEVLARAFKTWWPEFETKIKDVLAAPGTSPVVRNERDLLVEAVELARNMSIQQNELRDYLTRVVAAMENPNATIVRALTAPSLSTGAPSIGRPPLSTGPTGYSEGVAGPSALSPGFTGPSALGPGGGPGFSSITPSEGKK